MAKSYTGQQLLDAAKKWYDSNADSAAERNLAAATKAGVSEKDANAWVKAGLGMTQSAFDRAIANIDAAKSYNKEELGALRDSIKNDVVGTWSDYKKSVAKPKAATEPSVPQYTPYDSSAGYDAAAQAYTQAQDAAYQSAVASLKAEEGKLSPQYDAIRNSAYTNARLKAIGNNEALAARGLAGNMYTAPTSGVSETSRVAQDVAMQNDINAATRAEQQARDAIALQILQAGYTKDQRVAEYMADIELQKMQSAISENQYAANYAMDAYNAQQAAHQYQQNFDYQKQQDAATNAYNQSLLQLQQQEVALNAALAELEQFGVVKTEAAAAALGVPVGTTNLTYQQLNKNKSSGGGGSSKKTTGYGYTAEQVAKAKEDVRNLYASGAAEYAEEQLAAYLNAGLLTNADANELFTEQANKGVSLGDRGYPSSYDRRL